MTASRIVVWPDPILQQRCEPVEDFDSDRVRELARELHETLASTDGLGLAAPQIGVALRAFVLRQWPEVFFNSEIVSPSQTTETLGEGCLSLPGLVVPVERPVKVKLVFRDLQGRERAVKLRGMDARAAQHEHDHTRGLLIIDRAEPAYAVGQ